MKKLYCKTSSKLGITVSMAVTMIIIISLITTTITISVVNTVKKSKLRVFATELMLVQDTIQELSFAGSINNYITRDITLTLKSTEQFEGENITDNTVLLHALDLTKLGIENSIYGTGKYDSTKDFYAISTDTMKVYYVAGYDAGDKIYYTLTSELYSMLSGNTSSTTSVQNIVFVANYIDWTNKPIKVTVKVPKTIDISSVTVTTDNANILKSESFTLNGDYNELEVNTSSVEGNYTISVDYTVDGAQKTQTYAVTNFDNEKPVIIVGSFSFVNGSYYINRIRTTDNGRIKSVKYADMSISDADVESYFQKNNGGYDVKGNKIKLQSQNASYTIYAEDWAGNYAVVRNLPLIPDGFYYVGGTKEDGMVISDSEDDEGKGVDYTCVGNQFVWVPVDYTATRTKDANGLDTGFTSVFKRGEAEETSSGSGIYKMTDTVSGGYKEPDASGYATESQEYYAMMKSVQKYSGFYIARFEAGDSDVISKRTAATAAHKVVSKKNAYVYNYVPWGDSISAIGSTGAVYLSQNMYKNSASVVSTLCYGVQWDAAMNFVSDADHDIRNPIKWGNYYNSSGDAATNSGVLNTTGKNEAWKAKNIYDLAGNVAEWTMESRPTDYRVRRGGNYDDSGYNGYVGGRTLYSPTGASGYLGFRVTLYITVFEDMPPIPAGFYYVGGTKDSGAVISDNKADEKKGVDYTCIGNQFVWVPVEYTATGTKDENGLDTGFTAVFKRGTAQETSSGSGIYKMTGTVSTSYVEPYASGYATESEEYYAMMKSVQKNHGFYIARFEAGDSDVTTARTATTTAHKVVSKKNAYVYNYVTWGDSMTDIGTTGAVYLSQNMYKDSTSVVSTLCYGVEWDAAMNFVSDANHNIADSVSWGNHKNSTGVAATNSGVLNTTGKNEAWKAKNIYDLAGNVNEWTMESFAGYLRIPRSGCYYDFSSADYRVEWDGSRPTMSMDYLGFRVALYLK